MTIADRIAGIWPATEALLTATPDYDYVGARDQAIDDVVATLYVTYAPEAAVPVADAIDAVVVQQQIAELAVLQLLPAARDVYMQEARRLSADVTDGVNATRENTDKFAGLKALGDELRTRTAERAALVASLIRAGTEPPAVPRVLPTMFAVASGTRGL